MEYRIGLDIGIGSVGWAVVSAEEEGHAARIEDFGTRIFASGEDPQSKESLCQGRRQFRGVRRLERRRSHRKELLRNHFQKIGLLNRTFNDELAECADADVYLLKTKGLDEKLSPAQLYKCLVHTCNHRGYREFYEPEEDDKDAGVNEAAANAFEAAFCASGKRTVSEYLCASCSENGFVKYRNRKGGDADHLLIRRGLLQEEARLLLQKQSEYYPVLTQLNRDRAEAIIFSQRDFEDGPGDPDDPHRKYKGFLETLGQCPFYKEEKRGFRGTVIADVFAVTNTLSQYRFVNTETGEYELDKTVAAALVEYLLQNAKLTMTDVKRILKQNGYQLYKSEKSDDKALGKAIKFLGIAKKAADAAGCAWETLIGEEQFNPEQPSLLHKIGELISQYQTPDRRKKEMEKAGIDVKLIKAFAGKKISGTAAVSYRYMADAINAFLRGDIYGNFQANFISEQQDAAPDEIYSKLPAACISDPEVRSNRVVFKAINETRKIVNAIVDVYGAPTDIVVEVASELGKSKEMRDKDDRQKKANEKANDEVKKKIAELLKREPGEVKGTEIERYKLFYEQEGKCAYSGKPLGELKDVLENKNRVYEIDHIVPFSLILDNTLNNKMLVFARENQAKGQQTPLMYMSAAQAEAFLAFVNHMASRKENPIGRKKLAYCRLETIRGEKAAEILAGWKSRNINDTRYITKYVCGLFEKHLRFAGEKKQHVFPVKGAVTQKFRREWFRDSKWGEAEKNRDTYLNHALDALVAANLTKPYIEIGSDALRLIALWKQGRGKPSPEYTEYLEKCVTKMQKYYDFPEAYTRDMLKNTERVPAFLPRLQNEVKVRFNDEDEEAFRRGVQELYGNDAPFIVPPHMPITSHKQDKKFRGCIADSNPIRVEEIGGETHKIKRVDVKTLSEKTLPKLRTDDTALREQLNEILCGKGEKYTVETYLKENDLAVFTTKSGQKVRKVSVDDGVVSNYYRKEIGDGNYTNLSSLKYYCVELYRDAKGNLLTCGVRFVDLLKKDKKLWRKAESLPEDYCKHEMYLFAGDYITITNGKGLLKFNGFYTAVYNVNQSSFCCKENNNSKIIAKTIAKSDTVKKYSVSLMGQLGGEIRCSEPLPCIGEKKSP